MALIDSKNTRPEIEVRRLLSSLGYKYRRHAKGLPAKPDIVFPSLQKAIFVHGCFWHQHARCRRANVPRTRREYWIPKLAGNRMRDRQNLKRLRSKGWKVLVVWECSLSDLKRVTAKLKAFLGSIHGRQTRSGKIPAKPAGLKLVSPVKFQVQLQEDSGAIGIDLFAGAGGLSLGAELAGIKVVAAVEADPDASATYAHNFKHTKVYPIDIRRFELRAARRRKVPLVLFGGPPCQGFSISNQRTRSSANNGNWYFLEFERIAKAAHPDWVVVENVKGILETEGGYFLDEITGSLKKLGYDTGIMALNALDHGVPQRRTRVFVVGSLHGTRIPTPEKTAATPTTVGDAIGDLPILENGSAVDWLPYPESPLSRYAAGLRGRLKGCSNHLVSKNSPLVLQRYQHIPPGGNWSSIPGPLMSNYDNPENCHTGIYRRLPADQPSIVIGNFRKNMLIHPTQNRGLSVREAARLQSFPDRFAFFGSIGKQQQQVGNAVPPLLSKAVFKAILLSNA